VFETTSKTNPRPPIGIDGFAAVTARLRRDRPMPVCAIAGITPERACELARAGADGVAVMSAVTKADDPQAAAAAIARSLQEGKA
jgi:thiamine-phosphate pyrophosphorylase